MRWCFDAQNHPSVVDFNGTLYTYAQNLQGDIVGFLDANGAFVVKYKYDAWGRKLAVTGSLAATLGVRNPFRYRGYVYDEETGLYYLRSRYYNAERERFINMDAVLGKEGVLLSHNTAAYACNNPVVCGDKDGQFLGAIVGGLCGAIFGALGAALNGDDVLTGAVSGAVSGAIAGAACDLAVATCGAGMPLAVGLLISAGGGAIGNGIGLAISDPDASGIDYAIAMSVGAVGNTICFGFGKAFVRSSDLITRSQAGGLTKAIKYNMQNGLGWKAATFKDFNAMASGMAGNYCANMTAGTFSTVIDAAVRATIRPNLSTVVGTVGSRPSSVYSRRYA